jgi:hypothetical protein
VDRGILPELTLAPLHTLLLLHRLLKSVSELALEH